MIIRLWFLFRGIVHPPVNFKGIHAVILWSGTFLSSFWASFLQKMCPPCGVMIADLNSDPRIVCLLYRNLNALLKLCEPL